MSYTCGTIGDSFDFLSFTNLPVSLSQSAMYYYDVLA
jgi:hypothetical protein